MFRILRRSSSQACIYVLGVLERQVGDLDRRIAELLTLRAELFALKAQADHLPDDATCYCSVIEHATPSQQT